MISYLSNFDFRLFQVGNCFRTSLPADSSNISLRPLHEEDRVQHHQISHHTKQIRNYLLCNFILSCQIMNCYNDSYSECTINCSQQVFKQYTHDCFVAVNQYTSFIKDFFFYKMLKSRGNKLYTYCMVYVECCMIYRINFHSISNVCAHFKV